MSIVEFLSQPFWQRLGLTLVHFLWQGLAVAVLAGAFVRVFRLKHGNARYGAYLLAFIAMIACPVVTFTAIDIPISANIEPVTGAESAEVIDSSPYTALPEGAILPEVETSGPAVPTLEDSIPLGQRISDWLNVSMPWILVIWMAGVVVLSVRLLMGFVGVYRWRHHLEPLPERLALRIASLSEGLGMRGFSRVFISPTVLQAMAVGYLRPMVLLPAAMVTQMQPEMLEAVIAHELAHIRRFDLWVNLVQRITETLLFYHPAVWWLSNCLRRERELCCDELAVKATGQRITYATTLENLGRARFMAKQPVLAAGLGQDKKPILSRVRHILGLNSTQRNCPFWLAGVITVLFLAALVIPTTLALTSRTNEQADIQEKKDEKELSKFKKTLTNGVTVELLCLYYGKDIKDSKFWKPDGSLMSNLESQKYRERVIFPKWSSKDFKFEYGLMVRFDPLDSLSTDVFVKQGQRMTYNYPKSEGIAVALVASDWNDRKEGFSKVGNIKVAVASGPWDTHKSSARISEPSVRYLDDKSKIMFSPPRKTDEWLLDVTVNSDSIDLDCFYELIEGSIHRARRSGTIGHPNWIGVEQRTPMIIEKYSLSHKPEQIKNYIIKYRKFEIIEFENISLKPNFKTDVQIKVEKSDVEGKSQHVDVETLLNKVRQAQRPTANMIAEWQSEKPQPLIVTPRRAREPDFSPPSRILQTYKAIIAGDKSRIEERELTFQSQKDTEPSRIREITYVFDGTMQKQLDHFVKGFENEYRGYRHTYDKNTQLLLKLLLAYPPYLDNPKLPETYNIKVIENKEKGLIILETSKENSGIHRFTIDPDKDYNIVKQEVILTRGKDYEINCIVKKQANGLWYQVAREQIRYSVKTGKPSLENKVTITKLDFNPEIPTGVFELQFPKGIKIWDGSLKDWIIVGDEEETSREPDVPVEGVKRPLHFPDMFSVGTLYIRDTITDNWYKNWERHGEANGEISVPAGKQVKLEINESAVGDLSFLSELGAEDIQMLSFGWKAVTLGSLAPIGNLRGLKALNLQSARFEHEDLKYLTKLSELEVLRLGDYKLTDESMRYIGELTSLRSLALWGTGISKEGLFHLQNLKNLTFLALNNCEINDSGLSYLKNMTNLEGLQLTKTGITSNGISSLSHLIKLKSLVIGHNNITDEGIEKLQTLTLLENLWINNTLITDDGLAYLSDMKNLKELYTSNTKISDASLVHLKGLKEFWHLSITGIGDEGISHLSELPSLKHLQIHDAQITKASIPYFQKMESIEKVLLSGEKINDDLLEALQAALPACKIWDPQRSRDYPTVYAAVKAAKVGDTIVIGTDRHRDEDTLIERELEIEVEKTASNNSGGDSKRYQLVTFREGMSIREALRFLGKAFKKNIIPSEKVAGQVPVNELYNVTFEETLQAILGTHKYIIDGKFIRVYTEEEFESIYPEEKTSSQVEIEKTAVEVEGEGGHYFEQRFELGKDIGVQLEVGKLENWILVSAKTIRFEKDGDNVGVELTADVRNGLGMEWQTKVEVLGVNNKVLDVRTVTTGTHGLSDPPVMSVRKLEFLPFEWDTIADAVSFRVSFEQLSPIRDAMGRELASAPKELIQGRITDPKGRPVADAVVTIAEYNPGSKLIRVAKISTNQRGYYKLGQVDWPYYIVVQRLLPDSYGRVNHYQSIRLKKVLKGPQTIDLQFDEFPKGSASLECHIVDKHGKAVEKFHFMVLDDTDWEAIDYKDPAGGYLRTKVYRMDVDNTEGRFTVEDLPAGNYKIWVIPKDGRYKDKRYEDTTEKIFIEEGAHVKKVIEVPSNLVLYGRVLFEDGSPAVVEPTPWPGAKSSIFVPMGRRGRGIADIDDDGYFAVYLSAREHENLKSGNDQLMVNIPTSQEGRRRTVGKFPFEILSEDRDKAGVIRVKRPEKQKPTKPDVPVESEQSDESAGNVALPSTMGSETKSSGDLTLNQDREGSISGKVVGRRIFYQKPESLGRNVLPENFERREDSPLPGVTIFLRKDKKTLDKTNTDETGHYVFEDVSPGDYTVWALKPAGTVIEMVWTVPMAGSGPWEDHGTSNLRKVEVNSEPQTDVDLHFRLDGISISGRVTDDNGNPVSGAGVVIELCTPTKDGGEGRSGAYSKIKIWYGMVRTKTDKDGRFKLDGLCPVTFSEIAGYLMGGEPYRRYEVRVQAEGYSPARILVPPVTEHLASETSRLVEDHKSLFLKQDSLVDEVDLPKSQGSAISGINLVLQKQAVVAGRVLDTRGNIVPGPGSKASLRLVPVDSSDDKGESLLVQIPDRSGLNWIALDETGRFRIDAVPPGNYMFEVARPQDRRQKSTNEPFTVSAGQVINDIKVIVPSEKTDAPVEGEEGWGEAVEGLAVRLRAKGATTAKQVTLLADARNDGPGTYRGTRSTHGCWLKVDGKWYGRVQTRESVALMLLKAGDRQLAFTQIRLSSEKSPLWRGGFITRNGQVPSLGAREIHQSEPLELSPGRHSVRLAMPTNKRGGKIYAYSNPVEIVILPTDSDVKHKPDVQVEGTGITAEKEPEFSAILSNGVTVELIGMCEYPSVDKQWWRPDGSLLINPPYDESNLDILSSRKPNAIPIEFAFRLSGNLVEPAWEAKVKGDEQAFVWWTGRRAKNGEFLTDIKSIGMFVKSDQRTLDLRLGFSFADRPYEWADFKNISIKPNFKPDVQVEAGKEALTAEKLVLKLVDNSGRPVAGAKVGTSVRTRDKQVLNSKLYWSLSSKEKDISDEDGKIVLTQDKLFPQSWNPDRRRALYILNEQRQIGAFCEISKDDERNQIELTLEPVCHVHGKLSSEDLEEIGRPLTWSNVYLSFNKDSHGVLSCMSEKQQFDFWVPPGEYELSAYGSGEGASTKHVRPIIEVKTGQSELDLGVVDLPATKLSTLIGKSAPEIGPIKAWKNGSPITLAELRGKAVIIYFDGTSPNTSRDLPRLVDLHNQFEANGLVIVALYNCPSMEALEAKWVEVYKKYGGVQNVPFRVAVDGGKSTFYEVSGKERPGATYAIYDITADPTTILIDPDGKIVGKLGLYGAKEKLENILGVEVKTTVSTWRQRFEEVYRLEDNRILKRIAPPFIPERRDYYVNENSSQASAISTSPGIFVFHWNGKLKNWGLSFTDKFSLNFLLGFVLRLKSFEYDGPEELLRIELPGDWIIRDEVSQKIKLKALEQLIDEELGRTIQFEKRTVERQVIVVTGNFKFHPPSETYEHKSVHLYADELDPDEGSGGGTADSVNDFILRLGSLVDMPVADQTESSKKILVPYRHHRSSYLRRIKDKAEKAGKLQKLLANLTKQTELQFRIDKRPVEVWFITEKQKDE